LCQFGRRVVDEDAIESGEPPGVLGQPAQLRRRIEEEIDPVRGHGWDCGATMNIILVSGKLARARTITLTTPRLVMGIATLLAALLVVAFGLQYVILRYAPSLNSPFLTSMILSAQHEQNERMQSYLRENLNALAAKQFLTESDA